MAAKPRTKTVYGIRETINLPRLLAWTAILAALAVFWLVIVPATIYRLVQWVG